MIPIEIDTTDLRSGFSLSESQVGSLIDSAVKEVASEFANEWEKEAMNKLKSARSSYVRSIVVVDPGFQKGAVELVGDLPNMIEQGIDPFDMKPDLLSGPKSKMSLNGGRYNTVPFTHGNPEALEENFNTVLPEEVYKVVKEKPLDRKGSGGLVSEGLSSEEIPEKYRQPESKMVKIPNSERFKAYTHKNSIYEGARKQQSNITGQNKYVSFRRVSENSDPLSWIHPGFQAKKLAESALENLNVSYILGKVIDDFIENI